MYPKEAGVSRAARANHKCPIIMEFENGSLQEFVRCGPGATSHYINQDKTAILCGVWEFVGQGRITPFTCPLLS